MLAGMLAKWQGDHGIKPVLTAATVGSSNKQEGCIAYVNIHIELS